MLGALARQHGAVRRLREPGRAGTTTCFRRPQCRDRSRRRRCARAPPRSSPTCLSSTSSSSSTARDAAADAPQPEPPEEEIFRALVLGTRDYARKCGFTRGPARPVGRHRLRAHRGDRRGGARARAGARRADAVAVSRAPAASTTRSRSPQHLGIRTLTLPIEPLMAALRSRRSRRPFAGSAARHHRGEHPGAHPRQPADGDLEQVRRAAAHHRQQVRAGGRLLHALRRHVGRARGDRRRAQDDGLSGLGVGERRRGERASSRRRS